jgi:carbon storage regulator CsrA
MLVLTRKLGETLVIDGRIKISIVAVRQRQVRVSIDAPKEVRILRGELAPLPNAADPALAAVPAAAAAHTSAAVRPQAAARPTVAAAADEPPTTDALDSSTLDSSLFATADAMVCESFGMCHALGQDRYRWDANGNSEMGAEPETELETETETATEMVIATELEMEIGAETEMESDTEALGTVAKTAVPTARPARPRRSLGLRGFRNARRNRAMAGHSNASSSNAVAARAATEQPAPASDVAHSVRATAG